MISRQLKGLLPLIMGSVICAAPALAQNTTSLKHTLVLDGLENPWDMAFLDDGTMFYTEKCNYHKLKFPAFKSCLQERLLCTQWPGVSTNLDIIWLIQLSFGR